MTGADGHRDAVEAGIPDRRLTAAATANRDEGCDCGNEPGNRV
jgi:hypothetical protein